MKVTVEATYEITIGDQKFKLTKAELVALRDSITGVVGKGGNSVIAVPPPWQHQSWQFQSPPQEIPQGPIPRSPSIGDDPHTLPSICSTTRNDPVCLDVRKMLEPFNPDNDGTSIR